MNNIKNVKLNNNKYNNLLEISQNEKSSVKKISLANENYSNQEINHRINISKLMLIDYATYRERERSEGSGLLGQTKQKFSLPRERYRHSRELKYPTTRVI